jgi:hypothetical protein
MQNVSQLIFSSIGYFAKPCMLWCIVTSLELRFISSLANIQLRLSSLIIRCTSGKVPNEIARRVFFWNASFSVVLNRFK